MKEQYTLLPNTLFIKLKQNALLLLLLPFLCSCSESPQVPTASNPNETHVSGTLASDTVWRQSGNPYIVAGDVTVPSKVTLTVEPGTEVRFDGFYALVVKGQLSGTGTPNQPILFTAHQSSPEISHWKGIVFENTKRQSILQYTIVEYADVGVNCSLSSPQIEDDWIMNNRVGISLDLSASNIVYNLIQNNIIGIDVRGAFASGALPNMSNNIITQNENGVVAITYLFQMVQNNIVDNFEFALLVEGRCGLKKCREINVRENWWGNADLGFIANQIFDNEDSSDLHHAIYIPYVTSEIPDVGPRL